MSKQAQKERPLFAPEILWTCCSNLCKLANKKTLFATAEGKKAASLLLENIFIINLFSEPPTKHPPTHKMPPPFI
jgi:hypothetical protein